MRIEENVLAICQETWGASLRAVPEAQIELAQWPKCFWMVLAHVGSKTVS